jgi:hypothetical protein
MLYLRRFVFFPLVSVKGDICLASVDEYKNTNSYLSLAKAYFVTFRVTSSVN